MPDEPVQHPLAGMRVLDFSHAAAGPYATLIMGDLGADVIKIEKPGRGDGARHMGTPMTGPLESEYYLSINRNKRGVALDLQTDHGRELALRLAEVSDVVVQNFRPGVMERLGLGYEQVAQRRPGIVYCSISAFGSTGPLRERPANDIIMQAMSGLMAITGEIGGGPVRIGAPVSDFSTGLFAVIGVITALLQRDKHPDGQHVEVAMLDSSLAMMANYVPAVVALGASVPRAGRGHTQIVPYQAFECADGSYVMVGAFTQGFWRRLCEAIGHPEWIVDDRFTTNAARLENRGELIPALEAIFRGRTREHWLEVLGAADVPASPVLELGEALSSEQARNNGVIHELDTTGGPCPTIRFPVRATSWPLAESMAPPRLGEHSIDVLKSVLGETNDVIESLIEAGVIGVLNPGDSDA